ncbi:RNA polymerase sigma factor [Gemmata obscuriglobus]|uniref:RNA polymerase sigma factor n=1 Tax=Gemmata obscuriglobus TaxID=114 RepID=UPI00016C46FF|nr:sigma-70 family RNA polymerase sigma factor [Gemmata obscuriglobus]
MAVEAARTDGQLLEAYSDHRDGAAFAELVRRHGPMVWGVCRRMLPNRQDAEDAFQATFLVLVRKSASVRPAERVGNWLHGVAVRSAQKAAAARRRERPVENVPDPAVVESGVWRDVLPILDEEVGLLPDRYRSVIVLCDLEQMTRAAVARRLGVPEGTVAGWLARARALLGRRLARRGVGTPALAALISERIVSATVPASVVRTATEAANQSGFVPVGVATLTEGVIRAMFLNKIRVAATALFVGCGVMASGAVLLTRPTAAAQPPRSETTATAPQTEHPVSGSTEGYIRVARSEMSAARYKVIFCKALEAVGEHFEQIYADAYTGKIEAVRRIPDKRKVVVELRAAEEGGYSVNVRVLHEAATGKPERRDVDLEQVVLRRLCARPEGRADQTVPSRVREPGDSEGDTNKRLQKEVDELRERVRALERNLSDRESGAARP